MATRVIPTCALAIAIWAAVPTGVAGQGGPAGVVTDTVDRRTVSETVAVFAEVVPTRESEVAVRVSGGVTDVRVETGTRVQAGDVLAVLDRELLSIELRSANAALAAAEAGVRVAEADLQGARQALARVEGLQDTNAFSQGTFDDRQAEVARAEGEMARAEAQLLAAEAAQARAVYDLDRAEVTAPFDAAVLDVMIDPGEYVQTGMPVALLLDTDHLEVEANVPSRFVGALSPGLTLDGRAESGGPIALTVRALLPTESTATRTRPVRFDADFSQSGTPVAVGQSITIDVPRAAPEEITLVSKDAVTQARGAWTVFVNDAGTAAPRQVEIGRSFGDMFEVLSGLAPGDEVVVRGNERLRPGQEIAPRPLERSSPAAAGDGTAEGAETEAERGAVGTSGPKRQQAAVAVE